MATSDADPIVLDGRTLEGGGQLLRLALCLSALTSTPVRIHSIRGNRSGGGGLKAQHLACVNWLAHACRARVEGAEKGSKELLFIPSKEPTDPSPAFKKAKVRTGQGDEMREVYEAKLDIRTAGSTGLGLQAILPYILLTSYPSPLPVQLTLCGGTNVTQSPSYDYIAHVLLPTLQRIGLPATEAKLGKRGWSHGGSSIGNFTLEIPPLTSPLPAFHLTPPQQPSTPHVQHLHATLLAPSTCHAHFQRALKQTLKSRFPRHEPSFTESHGNLTLQLEDSRHPKRMYLLLAATVAPAGGKNTFILARDELYTRKLPNNPTVTSHNAPAEAMAEDVCAALAGEVASGACVDEFMRDQLVVFQALAGGRSEIFGGMGREASLHARTAEWVAETLLGGRGVAFDGEGGATGCAFGVQNREDDGVEDVVEGMEELGV